MKVCHITSAHESTDDRIFLKECVSLAQAGFDVYQVAYGESFEKNGVKVIGLGEKTSNRIKRILVSSKRVYQEAQKIDADIYHFHDPELLPYGRKLKKQNKIVIYDSHEDVPRQILAKEWIPLLVRRSVSKCYEIYEKHVAKKFDCVVAATPYISEIFKKAGIKTCVARNFPVLTDLHGNNEDYYERDNIICYAGGLTEQRGITELVKVMEFVDAKLKLAGDIEKDYLERLEKMPGFANVEMKGFLNRIEIENLYNESRIGMAVLQRTPNHLNALAIKLFEYMAAGIPVICSDFPLWQEIVEQNGCGFCVDPMDSRAICNRIKYLLDNPKDAKRMGDMGKRVVNEKYNWDKEKENLLGLYKNYI